MQKTVYSPLQDNELVELALCRDTKTNLEVELAQRLQIALGMISEMAEDALDGDDA